MRRWLWFALGLACVLPLAAVDPAAVSLLLDVEFLVAIASAGVLMLQGDARAAWYQLLDRPSVLTVRAGVSLTREYPRSLLDG